MSVKRPNNFGNSAERMLFWKIQIFGWIYVRDRFDSLKGRREISEKINKKIRIGGNMKTFKEEIIQSLDEIETQTEHRIPMCFPYLIRSFHDIMTNVEKTQEEELSENVKALGFDRIFLSLQLWRFLDWLLCQEAPEEIDGECWYDVGVIGKYWNRFVEITA